MTVLVLENVSSGFRGEVTQWLLEIKTGVFVGNISAAVRQRLWKKVNDNASDGAALLIFSAPNEQGFAVEVCHMPERNVVDMEGIYLIKRIVNCKDD